jgi:ribosomal protein S18 acetylase RimI-like enzyme
VISLRPVSPGDEDFLFALYASTRADLSILEESQREAILRMQYKALRMHFEKDLPDADHKIVLLDGRPIGKLTVVRAEKEIRIAEIALLPENRGSGLGSQVIEEVLAEADAKGLSVSLYADQHSMAVQWYQRLGFSVVGGNGIYCAMERMPSNTLD